MKVNLVNIDSKLPNIALHKIALFHEQRGDEVFWDFPLIQADKTYVSCLYTKNKPLLKEYEGWAEIGGTGFNISKQLPEEIEAMKPKINIGFTSRGCIRKCHFCVVPEKEGKLRATGDIYDFWDGKSKNITILDNNILGLEEHFKMICGQIRKENLKVDFKGGLDMRLLNDKKYILLKNIRHTQYKFAWDLDEDETERLIELRARLGECIIFVICGFLSFGEIFNKVRIIKETGHVGYIMRHESIYHEKRYINLARWVNQRQMFKTKSFEEFCEL